MKLIRTLLAATLVSLLCGQFVGAAAYVVGTPGAWAEDNTGAAITPALPAFNAGDVGLTFTRARGASETLTVTGWTEIASITSAGSAKLLCRIMQGGDTAQSINWSGTTNAVAQTVILSGDVWNDCATIASAVAATDNGTATNTIRLPGYTPAHADTLVITGGGLAKTTTTDGASVNTLAGWTQLGTRSTAGTRQHVVWGYQQQTTATAISTTTWSITAAEGVAQNGNGFTVALRTQAATPAPTFDTNPSVSSQTTTAYTIPYDADANAANIYCGAYPNGASAPTGAQLEAGTGAHGTATEATTGSADSIVLTPSDSPKYPLYDLYCVLEGAGGYSSVQAIANEFLDAPATCGGNGTTQCQWITVASIGAGSPCASFNSATNPDIAASDILKAPTTTNPGGFALTIGTDCQFGYSGDSSRQDALNIAVYDDSAQGYHADDIDFWANDPGPTCGAPDAVILNVDAVGESFDLDSYCAHSLGDALSYAVTSGTLPTGKSLAGATGVVDGTATVENETGATVVFTATSTVTGATAAQSLTFYTIDTITVPNFVGDVLGDALTECENVFLSCEISGLEYSPTVPAGSVISQDPAASTEAEPFDTVDLVISRGMGGRLRGFSFDFDF